MAKVLILGGTRNLGRSTALALLHAGHAVTVLNRGITADDLPPEVERLRGTRGNERDLRSVVAKHKWDVVVDTTSYTGADALELLAVFGERCGRIVFVSTGQVYLVRTGVHPPFKESDYNGDVMPPPAENTADYKDWLYGNEKRNAENILAASARSDFPVVSLRLPMIASERDHYARIQGYSARVLDGGPILVPDDGSLPIRHVYVEDAAAIISHLCTDKRQGAAQYNISSGESHSLQAFFDLLGDALGQPVNVVPVKRGLLESRGLLPVCSPYSGKWMSVLDSTLSTNDLAASYSGPRVYVPRIVADYVERWIPNKVTVPGYGQRRAELDFGHGL